MTAGWDELEAEIAEMERKYDRLAVLLRALREEFGDGCFDGSRISCRVANNPALLAALDVVLGDMKMCRGGFLRHGSLTRLQKWLENAVEAEAAGLWIAGDEHGWRYVRPVNVVEEDDAARAMLTKTPATARAYLIGRDADSRELWIEDVDAAEAHRLETWGRA
jgi:hypothetical protein